MAVVTSPLIQVSLSLMIACGGSVGLSGRKARHALHGRADGHELDQRAEIVNVGPDAHHVVGADRLGLVADQSDGVFAGVVDQRREIADFAAR